MEEWLASIWRFCFILDLAADSLFAMMRFLFFGSMLSSGGGAFWRPPLPLPLGFV